MRLLFEGTRYDNQAAKILADSGLMDKESADTLIYALFRGVGGQEPSIHAFVHAPNWLEKYLKGIARMIVEECGNGNKNVSSFLVEAAPVFNYMLTYVKENRDKLGGVSFDNQFNNQMHYADVVKMTEEIQEELERQSTEELKNKDFSGKSNFTLVPINSYEEFHEMFGGRATGDGSSDKYAGGGGTAWCHANDSRVYDSWIDDGKYKFYVLANNDWKNIPFGGTPDPNHRSYSSGENPNPKDDYGNSLIAIRAKTKNGKLENATLRCNHVGVEYNPDNQYKTYAELSDIAGFNVEEAIKNDLGVVNSASIIKNGLLVVDTGNFAFDDDDEDVRDEVTKIVIKDGVTSIMNYAFAYCENLREVDFGNTVEYIGESAFFRCSSLERIVIPDSVASIDEQAFNDCNALKSVVFGENSKVKIIPQEAFEFCINLEDIKLPKGLTHIGIDAFYGCESLKKIELPENVKLEPYAFRNCGIESIKMPNNTTEVPVNLFCDCTHLTDVKLHDGITKIGRYAFYRTGITSIDIPNSVTDIEANAFYECESLKEINIPDSVTAIGESAFSSSGIEKVVLQDTVRNIGPYAFNECYNLTSVKIPFTADINYGGSIFRRCLGLTNVEFSKVDTNTKMPFGMFMFCEGIKDITIPEGVVEIGVKSFYGCKGLEKVNFPSTLTNILDSAFYRCDSLKEVVIPKNVSVVSTDAFWGCKNLTSVTIEYSGEDTKMYSLDAFECCNQDMVIYTNNKSIKRKYASDGLTVKPNVTGGLKVSGGKWVIKDPASGMKTNESYGIRLLFEGTRYDNQAAKNLASGINIPFEEANKIIQDAFKEKIHAFTHSPNWLEKYLKGIARMIVDNIAPVRNSITEEQAVTAAQQCVDNWADLLDGYLSWIKENREKIGNSIDNEFVSQMSIDDVNNKYKDILAEIDKQNKEEMNNQEEQKESYSLVPINSYDEFHSMYGGRATGDGSSDAYAGGGGTAWCHANNDRVYFSSNWVNGGRNKFYVLQNDDWKNIPFNRESNAEDYRDAYGNSLMALLVDTNTGALNKVTLRCNHVWTGHSGVPSPDNVYRTYSELSKIAGFNVEEAVLKDLGKSHLKDTEGLPEFISASLLTEEEYEYNKDIIPQLDNAWWLYTDPDYWFNDINSDEDSSEALCVGFLGDVIYVTSFSYNLGVRPVLKFKDESMERTGKSETFKAGDKFNFCGYSWTILKDDTHEVEYGNNDSMILYALCDDFIAESSYVEYSDQDESTAQVVVDKWFEGQALPRQEERQYSKYVLLRGEEYTRRTTSGETLYRIKILREDLKHNSNDPCLGGWLQSYDCLSQDGDCMVYGKESQVYGNSSITENATVSGNSNIFASKISGNARISQGCEISASRISGEAYITASSEIDSSIISGETYVDNSNVTLSALTGDTAFTKCKIESSKIGGDGAYSDQTLTNEVIDYNE